MKILSIIEGAYRGTLEEQDDAAIWCTHALKNAGSEIHVLLRGNAVNYAVKGHDPSGIAIGGVAIEHPPALDQDLTKFKSTGATVAVVREDLEARGISLDNVIGDVELVSASKLAEIVGSYDQILHW